MLPRILPEYTIAKNYHAFLVELCALQLDLEIHTDFAARLSMAVDNSIYQVIPQAVIHPKTTQEIASILQLAHQENYRDISFCPRGGGTSTNGQSLSAGIILDCSKHMRDILEINLEDGWVRVQPGVVLDQLNSYLKSFNVSFAPEISPSNRATIGGMVNTDACGTGSRILGRTSDHVMDLTCVLYDGSITQTSDLPTALQQQIINILEPKKNLIAEKFTSAPRTLNGYNLKGALTKNLNYLFCGSEGTLAVITECKLKLTPIPKYKKLLVVKYRSFDDALRSEDVNKKFSPLAIEAIDERLIDLARLDPSYIHIKNFIDGQHANVRAINIVEFVAEDEAQLDKTVADFCLTIEEHKKTPQQALGYYIAQNADEAKLIWELRKKSVGIISKKTDGTRRPIPFVEDTAVPPENLADYISDFKALLDQHNLLYGMYGHVEAGCVHVRPALDMKLESDEHLVRELTDNVVALIKKYNGVLWGEHGHGFRSEYGETFFGKELYFAVRQIKTLFDPYNQLNPGKIAVAVDSEQSLVSLDGPMRGEFDKQIPERWQKEYSTALTCNGNSACFNYATADVMCPSYKVTQDRVHSPKGRATLMREWLRQLANKKFTINLDARTSWFKKLFHHHKPDFSKEVYAAMSGCLSCKACESQCPLNVDVPEFKAKFLAIYHQRYARPLRDYFIATLETAAHLQSFFPKISSWVMRSKAVRFLLRKYIKLVDAPHVSKLSIDKELKKRHAPQLYFSKLQQLTTEEKSKSIILLQDTFTSFYEPRVVLDIYDFLTRIGFAVYIAPFFENGKPLHVKGFLNKFARIVKRNSIRLKKFAELNIPLVGIDPSITLTYRDEYQKITGDAQGFKVLLLQEWFSQHLSATDSSYLIENPAENVYYLLAHCTEKTLCVEAEKQWQRIFEYFGLQLKVLTAGCCGMAGVYGHEVEHVSNSKALFKMDWQHHVSEKTTKVLATGYSCRSQTQRLMGVKLLHPLQVLSNLF